MASSIIRSSLSSASFCVGTRDPRRIPAAKGLSALSFPRTTATLSLRRLTLTRASSEADNSKDEKSQDPAAAIKKATEQLLQTAGKATEVLCEKAGFTAEQIIAQTDATTAQLKVQAEKTTAELCHQAEKAAALLAANAHEAAEKTKETLASVKDEVPEPVKDIAEIAITSHSKEAVKKGAVIHDFCLGIPYGASLLLGGLAWFVLAGSINALRFGAVMGSALLYSSVSSLKAWRAGKSSTFYIIAQGVISTMIFLAEAIRYSKTAVFFPTAITAVCSAAMVGFYAYVILAGGNPPPKTSTA